MMHKNGWAHCLLEFRLSVRYEMALSLRAAVRDVRKGFEPWSGQVFFMQLEYASPSLWRGSWGRDAHGWPPQELRHLGVSGRNRRDQQSKRNVSPAPWERSGVLPDALEVDEALEVQKPPKELELLGGEPR